MKEKQSKKKYYLAYFNRGYTYFCFAKVIFCRGVVYDTQSNVNGGENVNGLEYRKLPVEEQVNWLNEELQKQELKKVAAELGMSTSTLTNGIRAAGFKFDRAAKQYVIATLNSINEDKQLMVYLHEHFAELQMLVEMQCFEVNQDVKLDKRIGSIGAKYVAKSVKVQDNIYEEFEELYKTKFHQWKMQDVMTQMMLEFIEKYKK